MRPFLASDLNFFFSREETGKIKKKGGMLHSEKCSDLSGKKDNANSRVVVERRQQKMALGTHWR